MSHHHTDPIHYLQSLIGRRLRITTTDSRMFAGAFKCTDHVCAPSLSSWPQPSKAGVRHPDRVQDRNVVLSGTHEYRPPPPAAVAATTLRSDGTETARLDMSSRYLGLVVVPGQHITRIEVEERV